MITDIETTDFPFDIEPGYVASPARMRAAELWNRGDLAIGGGLLFIGAVIPETVWWLTGSQPRLWVFPLLLILGILAFAGGLWQRWASSRLTTAGIVLYAHDPKGGSYGPSLNKAATDYSRRTNPLTFLIRRDISGDAWSDERIANQLVHWTNAAIRVGCQLRPGAGGVQLFATMRVDVAFWVGARLGNSPVQPIELMSTVGKTGDFVKTAVLARPGVVKQVKKSSIPGFECTAEHLDGGDPSLVALAVTLQGLDPARFDDLVRRSCREQGVGQLVILRNRHPALDLSTEAYAAALAEVSREWGGRVNSTAQRRFVYLEATCAFALALGALLAGTTRGLWTPYRFDSTSGTYVPFLPERKAS